MMKYLLISIFLGCLASSLFFALTLMGIDIGVSQVCKQIYGGNTEQYNRCRGWKINVKGASQ